MFFIMEPSARGMSKEDACGVMEPSARGMSKEDVCGIM